MLKRAGGTMKKGRVADDPMLLTVSEAAKLLRISRGLVYELVRQERIPFIRLGRRLLIPRRGLEEWIAREAGLPPPPPSTPLVSQRH
jgi:excisionase family DNA binding protein